MHASGRLLAPVAALVGVMTLVSVTVALAQTTVSSTVNGTATTSGRISRTIIDTEPNGKTQSISYPVGYTFTNGQSASSIALGYRDSLNAYLGAAGFRAYFSPTYTNNNVRLTKASNINFTTTAEATSGSGVSFAARTLTVEDAPIGSPWSFTALGLSFTALAWWMRRRRRTA